jgi:hypothetical protein
MNGEDAKKLATPGPVKVAGPHGYPVPVVQDREGNVMLLCQANGCSQGQAIANATLIAHHWNRFDDVVDSLDKMIGAMEIIANCEAMRSLCEYHRVVLVRAKEVNT